MPKSKEDKPKGTKGNKEEKKTRNPGGGRKGVNDPTDADAIQEKIDTYFESCLMAETRPTYCGLALALDYASRQSLWENSKANSLISLPLKKAMLRIEDVYEQGLASNSCTGSIFALKNRGWQDKSEIEHSGNIGDGLTPEQRKARIEELEAKRKGK